MGIPFKTSPSAMENVMGFNIKLKEPNRLGTVYTELQQEIANSRFKCEMSSNNKVISFHKIRLKTSKPYCGNHAGPCLLGGPDKKGAYLEGADWVAWNDMVNSVLDRMVIEANVSSLICVIRKGFNRRIEYSSGLNGEWNKEGVYANRCGQPPKPSKYPVGTPGIYSFT